MQNARRGQPMMNLTHCMGAPVPWVPPADVGADALFVRLLARPRAWLPIELALAGRPAAAFRVHAVHPLDERLVLDEVARMPPELQQARVDAGLAALALHDDRGLRVFTTGRQLLELLRDADVAKLIAAVGPTLRACSPSYRLSNVQSWRQRLIEGAELESHLAVRLAYCADGDTVYGAPRPDRFFGLPIGELTDGQWLAYRAARFAFVESKG